ncbi:MAG: ABC transporter permease [Dysgonamonadaceae bacterium]|jgi:ABC-2 type transport system permease protein|nr:ABC transporter permease [Dysgonamonadaceae bacterium]MDD3308846.1 ABC transporter permease [Dysgonamonadaceae bacterium]MDD3900570.1 ABC transporter permease [Dysgonamonadaceae bacterium]MDD4398989.1 ABC transporter permease [Dysgonamonadaceae bacterium]MEA5080476.1 ABC transporter permease [Dysgonamonadaceae bacterium]
MKQLIAFVNKEFHHIFRDSRTLLVILGIPIVQILLFGFAINMEVQDIRVAFYDPTPDAFTTGITERIRQNAYFNYLGKVNSMNEMEVVMRKGKLDLAIVFEQDFQENLVHSGNAAVQLLSNSSDPNRGSISVNYAMAIIADYQKDQMNISQIPFQIQTENRMVYNPLMKSSYMFVPGIMGLVMMIICTIMTSVSIVREKERGTMEVLLASPLKHGTMIFAKTIPYMVISFIDFIIILLLSYFVLDVPVNGSLFLLCLIAILYIFLSLSYGLTISTLVDKQVNAVIISAMTAMIPVLMLSGMIFPIDNMPNVLQYFSTIVPARWFIDAIRKVMIQGQGLTMVWKDVLILIGMTVFLLAVTAVNTKKRLE